MWPTCRGRVSPQQFSVGTLTESSKLNIFNKVYRKETRRASTLWASCPPRCAAGGLSAWSALAGLSFASWLCDKLVYSPPWRSPTAASHLFPVSLSSTLFFSPSFAPSPPPPPHSHFLISSSFFRPLDALPLSRLFTWDDDVVRLHWATIW